MSRDDAFLARFEAGELDPAGFGHHDHVRAAFLLLRRLPLSAALGRYAAALRRLVSGSGTPGRYNETITVAFMAAISDRLVRQGADDWQTFCRRNPDLLDKNWIWRLYGRDELDPSTGTAFRLPQWLSEVTARDGPFSPGSRPKYP